MTSLPDVGADDEDGAAESDVAPAPAALEALLLRLEQDREHLVAAGDHLDVADCDQRMATVLDELGYHAQAERLLERALTTYLDGLRALNDPSEHPLHIDVAECQQRLASARFQQGRHEEARQCLEEAYGRLLRCTTAELGDMAVCGGNLAIVLSALGDQQRAHDLLLAALAASQSVGRHDQVGRWEVNLGNVAVAQGRLFAALAHFARALDTFEVLGLGLDAAYCHHNLGNVHAALGNRDRARYNIETARHHYTANKLVVKVAAGDLSLALMDLAEDQPNTSRTRLEGARRAFVTAGLVLEGAVCEHALALVARRSGETSLALDRALRALAVIDAHRYTLHDSRLRSSWSLQNAAVYDLCFELAAEADDGPLVAELVESARVQGVPAFNTGDQEGSAALTIALVAAGAGPGFPRSPLRPDPVPPDPSGPDTEGGTDSPRFGPARVAAAQSVALAAVGLLPLGPCPAVAIAGHSRLGALDAGLARPLTIELGAVRAAVGGADACWLGYWHSGDTLWWSLLRHDQPPASGRIGLFQDSPAHLALARLRQCHPDPLPGESGHEAWMRQHDGALGHRSFEAEGELAAALGAALLPDELAADLRRRASRDEPPMSLVIAPAPILGRVPFALLAVPAAPPEARPLRILESAVVRLTPSAALVHALGGTATPFAGSRRPLAVAVIDPLGDLAHARTAPAGARRILAGPCALADQAPDISAPATRAELASTLTAVGRGTPGVLVYQGHAVAGTTGISGTAALLLSDGEVRASDLLHADRANATFPFPDRVLLSACSSSGAAGTAEWLGLGPAALWAGAREVVVTSWSVLDEDAVRNCDLDLARMLRRSDDVAVGLRDLQLAWMADWQRGGASHGPPVVWAAYQVIDAGRWWAAEGHTGTVHPACMA